MFQRQRARRTRKLIRTTNREDLRTSDRARGRFYWWKEEPYISVTNANRNGFPAPALMYWAPRVVAEYVADNPKEVAKLGEQMDRSEFISLLKNKPWNQRDKAGDIGTAVHDLAEQYALTGNMDMAHLDPKIQAKARQFAAFMEQVQPEIIAKRLFIKCRVGFLKLKLLS